MSSSASSSATNSATNSVQAHTRGDQGTAEASEAKRNAERGRKTNIERKQTDELEQAFETLGERVPLVEEVLELAL
jgi:hypothetical protein